MGRKFSRSRFLKIMGAAGVAGSTLSVLACQPNTNPQSGGGGGGGPEEKVLNLYNWADYVAKSTIPNTSSTPWRRERPGADVARAFFVMLRLPGHLPP